MQPANPGENPWTNLLKDVQATRPERKDDSRSSPSQERAGGTHAWREGWSSSSSGWDRSHWSVPTKANLTGPDHETDSEWHKHRKWHASGWVNDPSLPQPKRAKPTHTDPEDDRRVDPVLPSGSTSKTWNPAQDQGFWTESDPPNTRSTSSASQSLHTGRDMSSNAALVTHQRVALLARDWDH